jgi:small subunit ribosomal protein S17
MQNDKKDTRRLRKQLTGLVSSDRMDKTIVVKVMSLSKHAKYKKVIKRYTKFKVHDEKNIAKPGDFVRIIETRPLSRTKRWRLQEIVGAGHK